MGGGNPLRSPSGIPLSQSLRIISGVDGDPMRYAVNVIDKVHGDGQLPKTFVERESFSGTDTLGRYEYGRISIREDPHPRPEFTTVHEIGHMLEHIAFTLLSPGRSVSATHSLFKDWRKAVLNSQAVQDIKQQLQIPNSQLGYLYPAKVKRYLRYATKYSELFARSYAQYIAVKSKDVILLNQLNAIRGRAILPLQWEDKDFELIAEALDNLFQQMGWIQ